MWMRLHKIKALRESRAGQQLAASKRALDGAERQQIRATEELAEFIAYRNRQETERYGAVVGKVVAPKALQFLREDIAELDAGVLRQQDALNKARLRCDEARQQWSQAGADHRAALKQLQKFDELVAIEKGRTSEEAVRIAELEMEDAFRMDKEIGGSDA